MAQIGTVTFANDAPLAVIAGPCTLEDCSFEIARRLKEETSKRGVGFVFKASFDKANRQSLSSPRGPGREFGLVELARIRRELNVPILTDIHSLGDAAPTAAIADCLQIPAFLCRQTDLVVAAARTGKAVNIKKGQFLAPDQMLSILTKAAQSGATDLLATERGASFGYGDLVFDPRSLQIMKAFAPVIFDATHSIQRPGAGGGTSGGDRRFLPALSRAAVAVGIAGIFIETHPDPANALSDRETQWPLDEFGSLLDEILAVDRAVKALDLAADRRDPATEHRGASTGRRDSPA